MAIMDDFATELVHDVTWERVTGRDQYGKPTYAAAVPYKARVDYRRRNFTNSAGQVVQTRGMVIMGGTPAVRPGDRITLPGGLQPPILDATTIDDIEGVPYHTEVTFG